MNSRYKFPDCKGRITIPFGVRVRMNIDENTLFSIEEKDKDTIVLHREKICDGCGNTTKVSKEASLFDVINSLGDSEQKAVFRYLAKKLTESEDA